MTEGLRLATFQGIVERRKKSRLLESKEKRVVCGQTQADLHSVAKSNIFLVSSHMYMYTVASNYRIINHSDLIQLFTEHKKSLDKDTMRYSNKESTLRD